MPNSTRRRVLADDVGLGKTIEAGLIARELLLRKKPREIIVSCPPSMIYQWKDELENRFGLTFEVLDKDDIRQFLPGFRKREVVQINIDGLPARAPELRLSALLDEYRRLHEQLLSSETRRKQAAAGLLITNLQQRLLCSIEAL